MGSWLSEGKNLGGEHLGISKTGRGVAEAEEGTEKRVCQNLAFKIGAIKNKE